MGNLLLPLNIQVESLGNQSTSSNAKDSVKSIRSIIDYLQHLASGLRLLAIDPYESSAIESLDLHQWWREAEGVIRNTLRRGHTLVAQMPNEPCGVAIAKAALTQILFNLVQNAEHAMSGSVTGSVHICVEPVREEKVVRFIITDTGSGMSDDTKRRCFEPFFTTKSRGLSTGMGLSLVHGLVTRAQGTIDVHSEFGRGTTFTIQLQMAPPPSCVVKRGVRRSGRQTNGCSFRV